MTVLEILAARRSLPAPGDRVRIRCDAGVTQAQMAADLGVHQTTLNRWERGIVVPRGEQLMAYLDLLLRLQAYAASPVSA